jgi:uncharacterized protein YhaN
MKIVQLDLKAFGPFTDLSLDFSPGHHGLHLVFGRNEAGKSSALRALRQLLYGIDAQTPDAFKHRYPDLRVGGTLRLSSGKELAFIRRKGNKGVLRVADESAELPAGVLAPFLGSVDSASFTTVFGIDADALKNGSAEIAEGRGEFGTMLFAASAGITGLGAIQKALETEAANLFRPQGKNQPINLALEEWSQERKRLREQLLSAEHWAGLDAAYQTALQDGQSLDERIRPLEQQREHQKRLMGALPLVSRRKQLQLDLAAVGTAAVLPGDFRQRRFGVEKRLALAKQASRYATEELRRIEGQLSELKIPEPLLEAGEEIEDLHKRLGDYQKAQGQRPERDLQKRTIEHEAKQLLLSLGRPGDLTTAASLKVPAHEATGIREAGTELIKRQQNLQSVSDELAALESSAALAREKLARLPVPPDCGELRRRMAAAERQGNLDKQLADAEAVAKNAQEKCNLALARLPHWDRSLAELERLPQPTPQTLQRFEELFSRQEHQLQRHKENLDAEKGAAKELASQIQQLELHHDVPTERDLQDARGRRALGWRLVRRGWLERHLDDQEIADYIASFPGAGSLADAYEQSVSRADSLADRLRREADLVARKEQLTVQLDEHHKRVADLRLGLDEAVAEHEQISTDWRATVQQLGLPQLPPGELRSWLANQAGVVQQVTSLNAEQQRVSQLRDAVAVHHREIADALAKLDCQAGIEKSLNALLEQAQSRIDRLDTQRQDRNRLEAAIEQIDRQMQAARDKRASAERALDQAAKRWSDGMVRLGLPLDATIAVASQYLKVLDDLFTRLDKIDDFQRRIDGIDRDGRAFERDVVALARKVAPNVAELGAKEAVEQMHGFLKTARSLDQTRKNLNATRTAEQQKRKAAEAEELTATVELAALCREAAVTVPDSLPEAESRSDERRRLENDFRQCAADLERHAAGATLADFLAELSALDADRIPAQLQEIDAELEMLRGRQKELHQAIGSHRTTLESMVGSSTAAETAQRLEQIAAQMRGHVRQFATLRLAGALLKRCVDRYREQNQNVVLLRASELFRELTLGSFAGLRIEDDADGQPALLGVRPDGPVTVPVGGMSEGSRDQLYLALRLATLEAWLAHHEPMPFIVDDILVNFDDQRACAALKALAALSARTQLLLFTHHAHLVELARKTVPGDVLFVQELPPR